MSNLRVRATFAFKSKHRDTVLLNDVYVDGELFRDHTWVEYHDDMKDYESGDILSFGASFKTRIGLDENYKQVQKKGFYNIKNVALIKLK